MYGTIARMKPKPGEESAVVELMREWSESRGKTIAGFKSSYLYRPVASPDELVLTVAFADRESYEQNADDPGQDEWYQRLRAVLQSDPDWEDGDIVSG